MSIKRELKGYGPFLFVCSLPLIVGVALVVAAIATGNFHWDWS